MSTLRSYLLGFALSVALTLAAFWFAAAQLHYLLLVALALAQLAVQLIFFLHLGDEQKPRWRLTLFVFALVVVGILVGGTLWIMSNIHHPQPAPRTIFIDGVVSPETQND